MLKIALLKSHPDLSGTNELTKSAHWLSCSADEVYIYIWSEVLCYSLVRWNFMEANIGGLVQDSSISIANAQQSCIKPWYNLLLTLEISTLHQA